MIGGIRNGYLWLFLVGVAIITGKRPQVTELHFVRRIASGRCTGPKAVVNQQFGKTRSRGPHFLALSESPMQKESDAWKQ